MLKTGGTDQKMTKEEFIEEANVSFWFHIFFLSFESLKSVLKILIPLLDVIFSFAHLQ